MERVFLVITIIGPDRRGIVAKITEICLKYRANIEESRMARLGGEFAVIMLVSVPDTQQKSLVDGLQLLEAQGLSVASKATSLARLQVFAGFVPYEITLIGADHEGIVHRVAEFLAEQRVQVETMDTHISKAPVSGTPLFSMEATVQAPPELGLAKLRHKLAELADDLGVDIDVSLPID